MPVKLTSSRVIADHRVLRLILRCQDDWLAESSARVPHEVEDSLKLRCPLNLARIEVELKLLVREEATTQQDRPSKHAKQWCVVGSPSEKLARSRRENGGRIID
jgi:hypothetical protein